MDKEFLRSVGGGDCPKHGRWYGICHSCANEREEDDRIEAFRRTCAERDALRAENQQLRKLGNTMWEAISLIPTHKCSEDCFCNFCICRKSAKEWREATNEQH